MKIKPLIKITGVAIGASLLSGGHALATSFIIDSFDSQPTVPYNSNQFPGPVQPTVPILRTGTSFPGVQFVNDPSGLPLAQTIGGSRNLNIQTISGTLGVTGQARSFTPPGLYSLSSANNSRVSSSLSWTNINPLAPASVSNSGRFKDRLNNNGALAFQTLTVNQGNPTNNPAFSNVFTFTVRDVNNVTASVSRTGVTSNQFVFIGFNEFQQAASLLDFNAINYVELNIVTGGGQASSVQVDFVQGFEVPEPSTLVGSIVVLGVGLLSTKRRQKAEEN